VRRRDTGPSIEDECADMTVIHGDVYSKLERDLTSKVLKERGKDI